MVDVQRLKVYRAVVAAGSIHAAASSLGYTPSAVSQQVSALSRETGLVLLEKVGRGVEPTAAGLELAESAGDLFDVMDELESKVSDLREGRSGSLSMTYFTSAAMEWIPQVVKKVLAEHPGLRLDLKVDDTKGETDPRDLSVIIDEASFVAPNGFRAHHLIDEPYLAIVPKDHPVAQREHVELSELACERWVGFDLTDTWCMKYVQRCCEAAGFQPHYSVHSNDHLTAIQFVAAGIGITVTPRLCTLGIPSGVVAVPVVNPTPVRSIHAVVRRAVEHTPPVRLALRELERVARATALSQHATDLAAV